MSTSDPGAPSLSRRAVHGFLWLTVLNSSASFLLVGLWAYLNRAMPDAPGQVGLWMLVLRLLLFVNLVLEGGLTSVLRQRSDLAPGHVVAIGRIQVALGLVGAVLLYLAAPVLAPLFPALPTDELTHLLRLCAPAVALVALGLTQKALMERKLDFRVVASIEGFSTLVFVVLGVWLGRTHGAEGLVHATILRQLVETGGYWLFGPNTKQVLFGRATWRGVGTHLRFGFSILAQSFLGNSMRNADVLIAGILLTDTALAVYAQLQIFIALPLAKITVHAMRVAFPAFAHVQDQPERLLFGLERMQRLTALSVFPALAGLVAVGPRLFWLYLGPEYHQWLAMAWPALLALCVGAAVYTYAYGVAVVLNAVGEAEALLKRQLAGALLVVGLVTLAGMAGFIPLAAGRSVGIAIAGGMFLALGRSRLGYGWKRIGASLWPALFASVAMGLLVAGLGGVLGRVWPASDPFAFASASASAVGAGLLVQVLAGVASYVLLLRLGGFNALQEVRGLLGRQAVPAPPAPPLP